MSVKIVDSRENPFKLEPPRRPIRSLPQPQPSTPNLVRLYFAKLYLQPITLLHHALTMSF